MYIRYASERMQQFVNICAPLFDKKMCRIFMVCAGNAGIWNCGTFFPNVPHFHGKRRNNPSIMVLYKTAYCGTDIKLRRTRWEKSGTHDAIFQLQLRHVCCIRFDAHIIYNIHAYWSPTGHRVYNSDIILNCILTSGLNTSI